MYLGDSFVAFQSEIMVEVSDKEYVMIVDINSSQFLKCKGLRETFVVSELLKQKFEHERCLGSGI